MNIPTIRDLKPPPAPVTAKQAILAIVRTKPALCRKAIAEFVGVTPVYVRKVIREARQ